MPTTQPKPPMVGTQDGVLYHRGKPQSFERYYRREAQARTVANLRYKERAISTKESELKDMSWAAPHDWWKDLNRQKFMLERAKNRNPVVKRVRERVAARKAKV